jgi:hypothetical protein
MRQLIPRRTPILESAPVKGEEGYSERELSSQSADFAYLRLLEFNKRIRSYGSPNWDGKVIPSDYGPILGKAQGCLDCHNGVVRGALTVFTSSAQLIQKYYRELSMPPDPALQKLLERKEMKNPQLSPQEEQVLGRATEHHEKLTREFEESRFPLLKKWFLEVPCR